MMYSRVGLFYSKRVSCDAVFYHFNTVKLYPLIDDVFKSWSKQVSCDAVCYHFSIVKLYPLLDDVFMSWTILS